MVVAAVAGGGFGSACAAGAAVAGGVVIGSTGIGLACGIGAVSFGGDVPVLLAMALALADCSCTSVDVWASWVATLPTCPVSTPAANSASRIAATLVDVFPGSADGAVTVTEVLFGAVTVYVIVCVTVSKTALTTVPLAFVSELVYCGMICCYPSRYCIYRPQKTLTL